MLVKNSGARAIVTFTEFRTSVVKILEGLECQLLTTDQVIPGVLDGGMPDLDQTVRSDDIAFLQHSSGTTGLQKGVALSHRAVLNQIEAYSRAIDLQPDDRIVSWLPIYHDMGLIAGFVLPLVTGNPLIIMSPFHWVRDPKLLLWAIQEYAGTLCWLPNFAFNHLARSIRPRDLEGLDLSTWRAAINCSEPVRFASHQLFLDRFSQYGFKSESLASCYAMAENTFAVTQSRLGEAPHIEWIDLQSLQEQGRAVISTVELNSATPMVSCGFPIPGVEVSVADGKGYLLPQRQVGEIILRSDSMLSGYYHRPDLTAQAIKNGWYHTGDMGYLADGHLYVTGRKKDLIIVGGKNIYPQDLEAIAGLIPGIYPGRAVAFGVMDEKLGTESIVMVCELQDHYSEAEKLQITRQLRTQVVQQIGVILSDVRLVEKRWVLKTSSGKIARSRNRDKYLKEFR